MVIKGEGQWTGPASTITVIVFGGCTFTAKEYGERFPFPPRDCSHVGARGDVIVITEFD